VSEVIVGILCGGLMMMILPSFSDGETLLDSLARARPGCWNMPSCSGSGETGADVRTAHEGVIGQILTLNVLRIQASGATTACAATTSC
jgi:uncharacterized membrane protein YccC